MYLVAAVTLFVALMRFTIPGHGLSYAGSVEALSHIWVGVLLALCLWPKTEPSGPRLRALAFWGLIAITVLEIVMFGVDGWIRFVNGAG